MRYLYGWAFWDLHPEFFLDSISVLIVSSFGVLAYFQSQQYSLGISINIAGRNRYLTSNLLLQTEKYLDGTSNALQLQAARTFWTSGILLMEIGILTKSLSLKYCHIKRPIQRHHQH